MVRHPKFSRGREGVLVHGKGSAAGEPRSKEAEEGQAEDAAGIVALCAINERRRRARRKEEMKARSPEGKAVRAGLDGTGEPEATFAGVVMRLALSSNQVLA
jgi:hypothetical protein